MKKVLNNFLVNLSLVLLPILTIHSVSASDDGDGYYRSADESEWLKVTDSQLAGLRGGFVLPNGIVVDISFEKRILQNGVLTSSYSFESPDNVALLNNGEFNIAGDLNDNLVNSVIQNNLDNQTLAVFNTINVGIKNLNNANVTLTPSEFYTQHVLPNFSQ